MHNEIKIVVVQMIVKDGMRTENFRHGYDLLKKLTLKDVDFIVFPELFDVGYAFKKYPEFAESLKEHATVNYLREIAEEYGSYVVAGLLEKSDQKFYDTAVLITPSGNLLHVYRKIHLFQEETKYFDFGESIDVADTKFGKVGLEICYDVRFPELSRIMAFKGARIIFAPAAFPYPRVEHWKQLIPARALENQIYFVGVNRVGLGIGKNYFGESIIADPWGDIIFGAGEFERVFLASIDLSIVDEVRKKITSFNDSRFKFYAKYYDMFGE